MVRIPGFHYHSPGSIPDWGTEILQATQCRQKKKRKRKSFTGDSSEQPRLITTLTMEKTQDRWRAWVQTFTAT